MRTREEFLEEAERRGEADPHMEGIAIMMRYLMELEDRVKELEATVGVDSDGEAG